MKSIDSIWESYLTSLILWEKYSFSWKNRSREQRASWYLMNSRQASSRKIHFYEKKISPSFPKSLRSWLSYNFPKEQCYSSLGNFKKNLLPPIWLESRWTWLQDRKEVRRNLKFYSNYYVREMKTLKNRPKNWFPLA